MVESTDGKSDNQVNSVLKKHYNQMTEVSEKMEAERDHQQQILQEKIQAKKQQKERCVCVLKCFHCLKCIRPVWYGICVPCKNSRNIIVCVEMVSLIYTENGYKCRLKKLSIKFMEMQKRKYVCRNCFTCKLWHKI